MSTNNSAKQDYERALGDAHHDNQSSQVDEQGLSWLFYALVILSLAVMIYAGVQFFIQM